LQASDHLADPLFGLLGAVGVEDLAQRRCDESALGAEVDMQPGPVRERLVRFLNDWLARLENAIHDAQTEGALDPTEDAGQLAFEIEAALFLANAQYVVARTPQPIERARNAIERRLASATTRTTARSRPTSGPAQHRRAKPDDPR
jgi:hypothetical protein